MRFAKYLLRFTSLSSKIHILITQTRLRRVNVATNALNSGCVIAIDPVCAKPHILDPASNTCLLSCAAGQYVAYERIDVASEKTINIEPRQNSKEDRFEEKQEEVFESEERFDGMVCRPCPQNCHKCVGPLNKDCVQCVSGAHMHENDSSCVLFPTLPSPSSDSRMIIMLGVLVTICAAIGFVLLYLLTRKSGRHHPWFRPSTTQYKYVPSGDGAISRVYSDNADFVTEYHDDDEDDDDLPAKNRSTAPLTVESKIPTSNGAVVNGVTPLLSSPDDDGTI